MPGACAPSSRIAYYPRVIERGTKVGRFVVVAELGSGGMGAVFAAHDPELDRQVALKVMRNAAGEEEDRVRMLREGQAMARVTHPNVITVYEVGTADGIVFLAQELLDGGTLGTWLEKPHTQDEIVEKLVAAGRGLAAAHAAGLVHRDFKPDNVLLGKDGRVRVADFGLARATAMHADGLATTNRGGGPPRVDDVTRTPMSPLTRTGAVMGTPMFMAPEQHRGERADARSDQFGFCVALYHALYKDWPFPGKTEPALADAVIEGRMNPEPKGASVPARLRKVLLRGLSTDPARRYPSMEALLAELAPAPVRRGRWPLAVGASVLLAGLGVGGYLFVQAQRDGATAATTTSGSDAPRPTAPGDIAELTTAQGPAWMTNAIDQGRLADAIVKYDLAAKGTQGPYAAMAQAGIAFMEVLRGNLDAAEAKIEAAEKGLATRASAAPAADAMPQDASAEALARGYIDLASSALAGARGQLDVARDRSKRCAHELEEPAPLLSAICHQLHGEALTDAGEFPGARDAYQQARDIATRLGSDERTSSVELAIAALDLDEGKRESAAAIATAQQAACSDRGALGCEVQARILLARIINAGAEQRQALEHLTSVNTKALETYRAKIAHQIALGEIYGYLGEGGEDGQDGRTIIENARATAEARGFAGLRVEAKLARVRVLLALGDDGAAQEHADLVKEARAKGFHRIAQLAEAFLAELEAQPQGMLPADGGLPALRP